MKRQIIITGDGSTTIQIEDWNEQYHSTHGAIQEANHVFIKHGLQHYVNINQNTNPISILEIGFGTGLNAFLTAQNTINYRINYYGVEAYPVSKNELNALNYTKLSPSHNKTLFTDIHDAPWGKLSKITSNFYLEKQQKFFTDITDTNQHHLIYFDAFGARVQPELWTESIFKIMFTALKNGGILVTYSAKGSVRRAMQSVGFTVERLPGPPGKREMLRATKP